MIYAYRHRIIAYSVLCILFLGVFTKVLPTENIDLVFFTAFCIAGFAAAHHMNFFLLRLYRQISAENRDC